MRTTRITKEGLKKMQPAAEIVQERATDAEKLFRWFC